MGRREGGRKGERGGREGGKEREEGGREGIGERDGERNGAPIYHT